MKSTIKLQMNSGARGAADLQTLSPQVAAQTAAYHRSFPMYRETPLRALPALAAHLCVRQVLVKDESFRFGLNAFKVLGGSYAIGREIARRLGEDMSHLPFDRLVSNEVRNRLGVLPFITATDGNHGRGVAWTARQLGQPCTVLMPKGSLTARVSAVQAEGAAVTVTDGNYDDAVRTARALAETHGYLLVQDTALPGYTDIPLRVMQGYLTLAEEMRRQLDALAVTPTHLFVQAGVGSLAAAMTAFFALVYPGNKKPMISVVEPNAADCVFRSAAAGRLVTVPGQHHTIMAGLACGEPNPTALPILLQHADAFLSISDAEAERGMQLLGRPMGEDAPVISGESGAAPLGAAAALCTDRTLAAFRQALRITPDSTLLFISTEGDTDPAGYQAIVHGNAETHS